MRSFADLQTRKWAEPVFALRKRLGIQDTSNPIMEGVFSPLGTLTLLSPAFAPPQPDWPVNSKPTGFVFYDKRGEGFGLPPENASGLSDDLRRFLANGPPPVLFTLGSSAVTHPGTFYQESAAAVTSLGLRSVLLVGKTGPELNLQPTETIHIEEYASYSALMPQVSMVVHQGGIGTVAQTLRAGKPMMVVPWAHDQPDNGYRLQKMGVARVLARHRYNAANAAQALKELQDPRYMAEAVRLAESINREDGLTAACDRIEDFAKRSHCG
jgi:UDP:flavonoid glycosyltransferase YjiC (YdhE family)